MSMIITLILEFVFIINLVLFWSVFLKENEHPRLFSSYKNIFPYIWTISLVGTLIINSNFLQFLFPTNISYFQDLWIWFFILGFVLILIGIKIISMVRKSFKVDVVSAQEAKLVTSGAYSIVRHPVYLAWILIFTGWSFILDSPLAILFVPVLTIFLAAHSLYEERYILIPKYDDLYRRYYKKVPYRLFSPPYNYLIIIIGIIVAYLGLVNYVFAS